MLLEKSPRSSVAAIYYENHELEHVIRQHFDTMFQKLDPNITFLLDFGTVYPEMFFSCLSTESGKKSISPEALQELTKMGFGSDDNANFELALCLLSPNHNVSYTTTKDDTGVIIEFDGEGTKFLREMDNLYEKIGEMSREEAAAEIARLASILRKDLKWS